MHHETNKLPDTTAQQNYTLKFKNKTYKIKKYKRNFNCLQTRKTREISRASTDLTVEPISILNQINQIVEVIDKENARKKVLNTYLRY